MFRTKTAEKPQAGFVPIHPAVFLFFALLSAAGVLSVTACKSAPENAPQPRASLVFDGLEAAAQDTVKVRFVIHVTNPDSEGAEVRPLEGRIFLDGTEVSDGVRFEAGTCYLSASSEGDIGAAYSLDMKKLASLTGGDGTASAGAGVELVFSFDSGRQSRVSAETVFPFPVIREPEFSVVSIAVMQAELVNTRFKVKVKISNPNPFPLTLSAFRYELYGEGRFWAGGTKKDVYTVPGNGFAEENLFLVMNFIEMNRGLLDQVIAMRMIRYRFEGEAEIGTGITYLPRFTTRFSLQGNSTVTP